MGATVTVIYHALSAQSQGGRQLDIMCMHVLAYVRTPVRTYVRTDATKYVRMYVCVQMSAKQRCVRGSMRGARSRGAGGQLNEPNRNEAGIGDRAIRYVRMYVCACGRTVP